MRIFCFFIFFAIANYPLAAQDMLVLKPGEYSSYHSQAQNGDWEGYFLHVNKMVDDKTWEIDIFYRTSNRDTIVRLNVPLQKEKGSMPADVVGMKVIRGEEFKELESNFLIVKLMNLVSLRFVNVDKVKSKKVSSNYCCNLKTAKEYEDKWEEFNYSLFHSMNKSVPILGLVSTRKSIPDFTTVLTSFGRNTMDMATYTNYPTYIDSHSLQEIQFPGFQVKYPSSWIVSRRQAKDSNVEIWDTQLGGNIHAGYFMVKITTDTPENLNLLMEKIKLSKVSPNHPMGEMMSFDSETTDSKGNLFYNFKFKGPGMIGTQMEGFYLNQDKTKLAEVIVFTNFGAEIPDKSYIPNLLTKFSEIVKSFAFNEGL